MVSYEKLYNTSFDETLTQVYAKVDSESDNPTNHDFQIRRTNDGEVLADLHFQQGMISPEGVNGVINEDFLLILIDRVESFQKSKLACKENEYALAKLYEALWWLNKKGKKKVTR